MYRALVLAGLWLALLAAGPDPLRAETARPNIVFLLADDAGFGDFGFTGHPYARTPAIDRLAAEGRVSTGFYVGGATCSPSRTAFMTGRFPASFAQHPAEFGFGSVPTLTDHLARAGYRTGHIGKWHLGPQTSPGTYGIATIEVPGASRRDPRGRDAAIADRAIAFLEADDPRPFFLNVWFHTPHNPVDPPASFVDPFSEVRASPGGLGSPKLEADISEAAARGEDVDAALRRRLGDLAQLDGQVGRILDALDRRGLGPDTIVLFTSDNGPNAFGSPGPYRGGKHVFYEGGVRLPLIVRWTGRIPAGQRDEASVLAGVDLLPTLCGLAGAGCPSDGLVGEDVSDIWLGARRPRAGDLFWRTPNPGATAAIRRGNHKLLQIRKGPTELYDVASDPGETRNIATREPAKADELGRALDAWIGSLPTDYSGSDRDLR
ncbi:MAG: sulfatase-like hydrolase/transferase [Alphaproteobacteria bacterium]|nr:sulfatase-like hydrolase/transferase [Alphaproteobacteria bacterium]